MNNFRKSNSRVRFRLRRAAEILVDDSSLRENLTDVQAKQLLHWGLAYAEEAALRTSALTDEAALPVVEDVVAKVRRSMRIITRIMGTATGPAGVDPALPLISLLKNVSLLTGKNPTPSLLAHAETLVLSRNHLAGDTLFQLLMTLINMDAAVSSVEEEE